MNMTFKRRSNIMKYTYDIFYQSGKLLKKNDLQFNFDRI